MQVAAPTFSATVTVGTTAAALSTSQTELSNGVIIQSPSGNSGNLYLGGSGVTSSSYGYLLAPGGQTPLIPISDLSTLFAIAANANQTLHLIGS